MRTLPSLVCTAAVLLATGVTAGPASATTGATPPTAPIVIDAVTANGTGCPPGTASITVDPDNTALTVTYAAYTASAGVGTTTTDWRMNCQLNVVIVAPAEVTYAISMADHRGFSSLATGAGARLRANYYFQGQTQTAYVTHTFTGPAESDWLSTDDVPAASMVWAPCGADRNLNLTTELRVAAGTSDTHTTTSFITLDSTVYHLAWASCP